MLINGFLSALNLTALYRKNCCWKGGNNSNVKQ